MEALSGETIYLPCNISTYEGDDAVLILWYRDDKGTPIYRYVLLMGEPAIYLKWFHSTPFKYAIIFNGFLFRSPLIFGFSKLLTPNQHLIFSIDVRGGGSKAAKRWSDEAVFGNRAYFIVDKEPGELAIQSTKDQDNGIYRCRVDFLKAQTRNSQINLTVVCKYPTFLPYYIIYGI